MFLILAIRRRTCVTAVARCASVLGTRPFQVRGCRAAGDLRTASVGSSAGIMLMSTLGTIPKTTRRHIHSPRDKKKIPCSEICTGGEPTMDGRTPFGPSSPHLPRNPVKEGDIRRETQHNRWEHLETRIEGPQQIRLRSSASRSQSEQIKPEGLLFGWQ